MARARTREAAARDGEKRGRGRPLGSRSADRERRPADPLAARVVANVRRLRIQKGMTQEELAVRMGVDTSMVGCIEALTRPGLLTKTICHIAAALGVSIDDLLADVENGRHGNAAV